MKFIFPVVLFVVQVVYPLGAAENQADLFFYSSSMTSDLSDENRIALVGFKVNFPDTIESAYALESQSIGVGLSVLISKDVYAKIEKQVTEAITDDSEMMKLAEYKPFRQCGAIYRRGINDVIVIATMPTEKYNTVEIGIGREKLESEYGITFTPVKINEFEAYWIVYPDEMNTSPALSWDNQGVTYMVFGINETRINKAEAVSIAKSVMLCN